MPHKFFVQFLRSKDFYYCVFSVHKCSYKDMLLFIIMEICSVSLPTLNTIFRKLLPWGKLTSQNVLILFIQFLHISELLGVPISAEKLVKLEKCVYHCKYTHFTRTQTVSTLVDLITPRSRPSNYNKAKAHLVNDDNLLN